MNLRAVLGVLFVIGMMLASSAPVLAWPKESVWTEEHTVVLVDHWREALTADDREALRAAASAEFGFYAETYSGRWKDCYMVDHGVTYSKATIKQFTVYVRKSWCVTTSLYPVVLGPFSKAWWWTRHTGNWYNTSASLQVDGWYSTNYIHQTMYQFQFAQGQLGGTERKTLTNSTCGHVLGKYTTGNDCSGTKRSATYTGSVEY